MSTQINEKSSPFHFQAHALRKSTNRTCLESSWLCLKLRRCLLASLLFTVTIPYSFFKASLCLLLLLLLKSFLWDPMGCSPPGSLSMEFSKQEYWSGLPHPPPRDLPDPGIKPRSAAFQADSLTLSHQGRPPLSLRTTKWPRDVAAHTKYTTIQKIIRASIPWGIPKDLPYKKWKYQNLWERGMA